VGHARKECTRADKEGVHVLRREVMCFGLRGNRVDARECTSKHREFLDGIMAWHEGGLQLK